MFLNVLNISEVPPLKLLTLHGRGYTGFHRNMVFPGRQRRLDDVHLIFAVIICFVVTIVLTVYLNGKHLASTNSLLLSLCIDELQTLKFFSMNCHQRSFLLRFYLQLKLCQTIILCYFHTIDRCKQFALVLIKCCIH